MKIPKLRLSYCAECGEVRVPHALTRLSSYISVEPKPQSLLGKVSGYIDRAFEALLTPERVTRIAARAARLGIGTFDHKPSAHDNTRTHALYEGANARGVTLRTWKLGSVPICNVAEKEIGGSVERVLFSIIPRPRGVSVSKFPCHPSMRAMVTQTRADEE